MKPIQLSCSFTWLALLLPLPLVAQSLFFDTHTHYNWDQAEIHSASHIIKVLRTEQVQRAVLISTPDSLSAELQQQAPDLFIRFFSPYVHELGKRDWFTNKAIIKQARQGLSTGQYQGIGEIHFMAGFPPRLDNAIFTALIALAQQHDVPMLIHIDSADESLFSQLCSSHPGVRFIFAHAGGNLNPPHIAAILSRCTNAWIDLSARDPWRYGGMTSADGRLLTPWHKLIAKYPHRFFIGTDPVWQVTRTQGWDEADSGWDHYSRLKQFHLQWLQDLPQAMQMQLRWHNAATFFSPPTIGRQVDDLP